MRKSPRRNHPAVSPAASPASTDSQRRRFLFTLGVSGAAAASVAAIPAVAAETDAAEKDEDGRYKETSHVRNYYRTTRI